MPELLSATLHSLDRARSESVAGRHYPGHHMMALFSSLPLCSASVGDNGDSVRADLLEDLVALRGAERPTIRCAWRANRGGHQGGPYADPS